MIDTTIRIDRGEYREQWFRVSRRQADGTAGAPEPLSGATELTFIVKKRLQDTDANAKIRLTLTDGDVALEDQGIAPGEITVTIPSSATLSLPAGDYYHQLWIEDADGNPQPAYPAARFIIAQPVWLQTPPGP